MYVYLEKKKSNTFDGFLGFNNDENKKIIFNGHYFRNYRVVEQISIYWKNTSSNQKVFNAEIDLPYLFNTAIGLKAFLTIFKQDSIFQSTKTEINLTSIREFI